MPRKAATEAAQGAFVTLKAAAASSRRSRRIRNAKGGCRKQPPLKARETNGDRTRDSRNHNPVLYQLSYGLREAQTIADAGFSVNGRAC
jgi:hypothetical protein